MEGFLRGALTAEEGALLDSAAAFSERTVRPNANEWERARGQPVEALREAASLGLLRLETPTEQAALAPAYPLSPPHSGKFSAAAMPFPSSW